MWLVKFSWLQAHTSVLGSASWAFIDWLRCPSNSHWQTLAVWYLSMYHEPGAGCVWQSLDTNVDTQIWSVAEVCAAIVCACLPTFRPLFDPRVRRNSIQKKVPTVNNLARDSTTAEGIVSTAITVRESISIEMEPCTSNIDGHHNPNENNQGHADFLTLVRNDWQSPPSAKSWIIEELNSQIGWYFTILAQILQGYLGQRAGFISVANPSDLPGECWC